jgi:hypothetical protein
MGAACPDAIVFHGKFFAGSISKLVFCLQFIEVSERQFLRVCIDTAAHFCRIDSPIA